MAAVFLLLVNSSVIMPPAISMPDHAASTGLPSRVPARISAEGVLDVPPNHTDTGLDAITKRYKSGSQRAGEVRADLSLSRKKSPAIPKIQIDKASNAFIHSTCRKTNLRLTPRL
jgi:hypothetical protein